MLEQPAQAIGCADDRGIAGRGGFSLDVVRGPKPFGMGLFGQALAHQFLSRRFEALAFGLHPLREFGGQQRQRRLGTRHRIVIFRGRPAIALYSGFAGVMTSWSANVATAGCPSSNGLGQSELFRDGGSARLGLRLGGFQLMFQSSLSDGVAFDPFSFQKDGSASAEVDVGRCQVL
jgi:hypothetical protein